MHTFRRYHLLTHLLRKAGHDTYLAYPIDEPKRRVALKVFDAECVVPNLTPDKLRHVEMQLRNLKHPHIVRVLELGIEQGKPYIVSEYQSGGSLLQYLEQRASGLLSLEEAVSVVVQVGRAVVFAHTHGILHHGIRPENILLNEQGKALLADFRLSGLIQEPEEKGSSDLRVANYLAPEQMTGMASAASDQYALGCLLYELMTGIVPNPPILRQYATLTPLVASTTSPKLPRQLEAVILRTLALKPHGRYPDVTTFLAALQSTVPIGPAISAFAQPVPGHQPATSSDLTEMEFLPLLPNALSMQSKSLQQEKKEVSSALLSTNSLETFLTTPEWDGSSLLDRLAIIDGPENGLVLPGASEIRPSSAKHLPAPAPQEQKDNRPLAATSGTEEKEAATGVVQPHVPAEYSVIHAKSQQIKEPPLKKNASMKKQFKRAVLVMPQRKWSTLLIGMVLMLTLTITMAWLFSALEGSTPQTARRTIAQKSPLPLPTHPASRAIPKPRGTGSVRIDAGGEGEGAFVADEDFTNTTLRRPSYASSTSHSINTSSVSNPASQGVYQSARIGDCLYTIDHLTPRASYKIRLHFAEIYWKRSGKRIFTVLINNQPVLENFDIVKTAGAADTAIVKEFVVPANPNGTITMQFVTEKNNAMINAIEVLAV